MDYKTEKGIVIDRDALTPRLQECLDIKNQYPDSIVVFEVGAYGDYFEAYGEDAVKVARILDLVVTQKKASNVEGAIDRIQATIMPDHTFEQWVRNVEGAIDRIQATAMPNHAFDQWIHTLLLAEESVIVVEWKAVRGKPDRPRVSVASMTVSLRETPESIDRFCRLDRGKPT